MKMVELTYKILLLKLLNRSVDEEWSSWAVEMMLVGFETEHLIELAGISRPFNQFELRDLTDKVFDELNLDCANKSKIIIEYVSYLVSRVLKGNEEYYEVISHLKDLCIELDYDMKLYDFYSLYFAIEDLEYFEIQCYWEGADRSNIDKVCQKYFEKWIQENPLNRFLKYINLSCN